MFITKKGRKTTTQEAKMRRTFKPHVTTVVELRNQIQSGWTKEAILKYWLQLCVLKTSPSYWDRLKVWIEKELNA